VKTYFLQDSLSFSRGFDFRGLLAPVRKDYGKYLAGSVIRQALLVLGGYSIVWTLRFYTGHKTVPLWWLVIALVAFDAVYITLDAALNVMFSRRISFPLFARLRSTALRKVFAMPLEWHQRESSGALVAKVNNGVGRVVQTGEMVSRELCPALIRTALSLVPLLIFGAASAVVPLCALLIFAWLTVVENRARTRFRRDRHENYVRDSRVFSEFVQAVQPVIQFGQAPRLLDAYGRLQQEIMDQGIEEMDVARVFAWRKNMVLSTAKRVCQAIWIWQMGKGRIDVAMVMYLNMLTEELLASFWGYASLLERIYEDIEPARMLFEVLSARPAIASDPDVKPVAVPERIGIRLVNVQFSYARGKRVVRGCNLTIEQGTVLGIVGRSGSGKTTLHHLLSRLFEVEHGEILVAGTDVRQWPLEQLRGLFSSVTQSGGVFFSETTVLDTIRFARPDASGAEVQEAARCVCIHDDIERMPAGYLTPILQGGANLSKGQQQRIALAQALLALGHDRKVIVLDEFTSQLDSETEGRLLRNLRPWLAGRTAVIIAHRLSTVRDIADRIVVVDEGTIVEEGSHHELMDRDGWYAAMTRRQSSAMDDRVTALRSA
jgi:ABC-type multidrug transport system fused ATPase/permease subunit